MFESWSNLDRPSADQREADGCFERYSQSSHSPFPSMVWCFAPRTQSPYGEWERTRREPRRFGILLATCPH